MGGSSEVEVLETAQDVLASFVMPESSLAICLVSGGMDSCVTAAIANEENDALAFLHVSYGQRTEARERQAFEELAQYYRVAKRLVVSIEHLKLVGGSSLTDEDIPVSEANLGSTEIPTSYVPFRNSHLLSIATSWGEVIGARRLYIGAAGDRPWNETRNQHRDCDAGHTPQKIRNSKKRSRVGRAFVSDMVLLSGRRARLRPL